MTERLSININDHNAAAIRRRMKEKGMSATQYIADAIALYEYVANTIDDRKSVEFRCECGCRPRHRIRVLGLPDSWLRR